MHEMSTCQQLLKQIEIIAKQQPDKQLKNIQLSVGELARVDVDELTELFPLASYGTCAENAKLIINRKAIQITCLNCNKNSDVSAENMNCPICESENTQLVSGTEMLLEALEFV